MQKITKATPVDARKLAQIAKDSFLPAHGHAGPKKDIDSYVSNHFNEANFKKELENKNNHYYIIYHENEIAGYSKIIFNSKNQNIANSNITKMERLYLLKEFYGLNLGVKLFEYNIEFAKKNDQKGIWVFVWVENKRAIAFYKKMGFVIVGSYNFIVSKTHSNPNHVMYLEF
ncbi:MAG: GNAT family N-acetyltransferase [Polaribacter sp.]|nr:GNAT family N-acetyltransferase [Polaribacter sp.]MDG1811098.1 GNAT family N-acetyltransferase [Polaribacter sp.]MDG1993479.1 GNAT family N-acetyltransferase [Polaribacter sp.]